MVVERFLVAFSLPEDSVPENLARCLSTANGKSILIPSKSRNAVDKSNLDSRRASAHGVVIVVGAARLADALSDGLREFVDLERRNFTVAAAGEHITINVVFAPILLFTVDSSSFVSFLAPATWPR